VNGNTAVAIIPARGGSKRIPHKNVMDFEGRPLIAWTIAAARESGLFQRVIVSTDDTIADPIAQWKRWPRMQAVRSATVYSLPSDLVTRASPRLAEGVSVTCRALEDARERLKRGQ